MYCYILLHILGRPGQRCDLWWFRLGHPIDCGIGMSITIDKIRVFINKTLSTESLINQLGLFVDSEIVLSTSYGKTRVFINKTLSTETAYQQDLINRDLLSTRLIVGKVGPGMWCGYCNSTSG